MSAPGLDPAIAEKLRSAGFFYDPEMAERLTAWEKAGLFGSAPTTFLWTDCNGRQRWLSHQQILATELIKAEREVLSS